MIYLKVHIKNDKEALYISNKILCMVFMIYNLFYPVTILFEVLYEYLMSTNIIPFSEKLTYTLNITIPSFLFLQLKVL